MALEMREEVLRTVQLGPKKEVKVASRLLHPGIVKGGLTSVTSNFEQDLGKKHLVLNGGTS